MQLSATDRDGASSQVSLTIAVKNINRPPKIIGLANQKTLAGTPLVFDIVASDPDGDHLELSSSGLPAGAATERATDSTFTFSWTPTETDLGTFRTTFRVIDPFGASDHAGLALTVEVPARPVNLPPEFKTANTLEVEEGEFLELVLAAQDPNQDPVVIYVSGSLPQNADFDPVTGRFTLKPDYTQSGSYKILFIASDGSLSSSQEVVVLVEDKDIPPVISPLAAKQVSEGERVTLIVTAADSGGDALRYEAEGLPRGAYLDELTGNFLFVPDYAQAGNYSIRFSVQDPAGNSAETVFSLSVNNTNQPPELTFIPNQFVKPGEQVEFLVSALDRDGDRLDFNFSSTDFDPNIFSKSTQIFTFQAPDQADTLHGIFMVKDQPGAADSQLVTFYVLPPDNRPPQVQEPSPYYYSEGETINISIQALDPDGDNLTYSILRADELPLPMRNIGPQGSYHFVADYSLAGSYKVQVQVSDGSLTSKIQLVINISDVNRPPVLNSIGNQQVAEGEELNLTFSAVDPDGDAISYEISALPRGASFDKRTGHFRFSPDFDQADTTYLGVSASDGNSNTTENFRLVILDTNRPPVLRRVKDPEMDEGGLVEFELEADDPDGDSAWLVIDTTRVPFLTGAMKNAAHIRNRRSFMFDTAMLIEILRIPAAVLKFYAVDEHGARSDEETVDIIVIRKLIEKIKDLPPGLAKKLDWTNLGIQIAIQNNSASPITLDINGREQSGRITRKEMGPQGKPALLTSRPGDLNKENTGKLHRYTYLSGSGEESAFYGIRRGWGLDLTSFPENTAFTTTLQYFNEDLPSDEVEGLTEANLDLFGFDSTTGQFVKLENAILDTDSNTVTFNLTQGNISLYTLGSELRAAGSSKTLNVELSVSGLVLEVDSTTNTSGPYIVNVTAPQGGLVTDARLFQRIDTTSSYQLITLNKVEGEQNLYRGEIPGLSEGGLIQYYAQMTVNFEMLTAPLNPTSPYRLKVVKLPCMPGDISGDGNINIFDLLDLLKVLAGAAPATCASDVDQNGSANIFDLLEILKILSR